MLIGCSPGTSQPAVPPVNRDSVLAKKLLGAWRCENELGFEKHTFLSDGTWIGKFDSKGQGLLKVLSMAVGDNKGVIGVMTTEGTWRVESREVSLFVQKAILQVGLDTRPVDEVVGRSWTMDVSDISADHFYSKKPSADNEPPKIDVYQRVY